MLILFVDDDPDIQELGKLLLERVNEQLHIDTTDTVDHALEKLEGRDYDAIISDYEIAEKNGLDLLETVHKERGGEIPFIIFTGKGKEAVAMKAVNLGVDRYIQKGGDAKQFYRELADAVVSVVEHRCEKVGYRNLFESLPDAVLVCDSELNFLDVNYGASKQLGYSKKELLSMKAYDIVAEDQIDKLEKIRHLVRGEKRQPRGIVFEGDLVTKNGKRIPVEVNCSQMKFEEEPAVLCVVRNISKRKRTEETIYNATSAMISQIGSDELFQQIVDNARKISNAKFVILSFYNREKGIIKTKALSGAGLPLINRVSEIFGVEDLFKIEYQVDGAPRFQKFSQGKVKKPLVLDGFHEYTFGIFGERTCKLVEKVTGVEEIVAIPVMNNDEELVGILGYLFPKENEDRNFTPLMIFGDLASQAIEKSRMFDQLVEAREKLKKSEEKYRNLVEQSHDGIFIYRENKLELVNERICEITGYNEEELYEMHIWDLILPEDREKVKKTDRKWFSDEKGAPNTYEARILTKEDDIKHLEFAVTRIEYKRKDAALGAVRDITERKKSRQKLAALHTSAQRLNKAESMDDIFEYTLDAMDQTLGFEHATIEMKKNNKLKIIKARGFETTPQKQLPLDEKGIVVKAAHTGRTQNVEDVSTSQEYRPRFSQTQSEMVTPIHIDGELFGVLNVESVEKHAFNQKDRRLLETLASHVTVAIKELQEKKKRVSLQRLDELRDQFLAMAGHEINTPLTPIKTNLEMLQREDFGELTEEQQQRIAQTLESVDRLVRLVNDFRRASQLQAAHITLDKQEHQLAHTIEKALKQYKYAFVEEEITLIKQMEQPLTAVYDEHRMIQVFRNLIENALDYTDDKIWIHGRTHDDHIQVSVRDNGPGIPADEQAKIFQPFYRMEDEARSREDRRFGGTGLGLNICKRIVEAHEGEIHVDSTRGEGSTFTVTLPRHGEEK